MKQLLGIVFFFLLSLGIAQAQEPDSMKYFVERFTDSKLSAEERRHAGLKIKQLQEDRYLKSKNESGIVDTLLLLSEKQATEGFVQVELATKQLYAILSDTVIDRSTRWRALNALAQINSYRTDSILIANIDDFNYFGEYPNGAGGEVAWMYPCFDLLHKKAALNYTLLNPILDNLSTEKTENELYFIRQLLVDIFSDEPLVLAWIYARLTRSDDPIVAKNFELLKKHTSYSPQSPTH